MSSIQTSAGHICGPGHVLLPATITTKRDFLYTNLRVEELLAERANASNTPGNAALNDNDATLNLTPLDETLANEAMADEEIPSSVSTPSGIDQPELNADVLQLDPLDSDALTTRMRSATSDLLAQEQDPELVVDPDGELMADPDAS